jgi:hypothetical protein
MSENIIIVKPQKNFSNDNDSSNNFNTDEYRKRPFQQRESDKDTIHENKKELSTLEKWISSISDIHIANASLKSVVFQHKLLVPYLIEDMNNELVFPRDSYRVIRLEPINGVFKGTEIYQRLTNRILLHSLELDILIQCMYSASNLQLNPPELNELAKVPILGPNRGVRVVILYYKELGGKNYHLSPMVKAETIFANDFITSSGIRKKSTFYSKINPEYSNSVKIIYDRVYNAGTRVDVSNINNTIVTVDDLVTVYDRCSMIRSYGNFYDHRVIDLKYSIDTEFKELGILYEGVTVAPYQAIERGLLIPFIFCDFSLEMRHYAVEEMKVAFTSKVNYIE